MEFGLSILAIAIAVAAIVGVFYFTRGKRSTEGQAPRPIAWRKNVLACLLLAYGSLLGLFLVMATFGNGVTTVSGSGAATITTTTSAPMEAYQLISVPFVALIGATVAIAKDLLDPD